jgi:RNA polymerase sigma-70 factor (ECF subfamily)
LSRDILDILSIIGGQYFYFVINQNSRSSKNRGTKLLLWMSNIIDSKKETGGDDDLQYVVLCRKGDVEAFEILVERHQKKMLNIAYRMLGDYDEACDVVQEAFLAAYKSLNKFKAEAKFSTWLYRIVVNYTKNRLKQRKNLARHESASLAESAEGQGATTCLAVASAGNPAEFLEQREREAHVQRCISTLDVEYREVLVMRDIQGFSYEEIRDVLRIPDGTVKSRLSRARNALKDCLIKVIGDL